MSIEPIYNQQQHDTILPGDKNNNPYLKGKEFPHYVCVVLDFIIKIASEPNAPKSGQIFRAVFCQLWVNPRPHIPVRTMGLVLLRQEPRKPRTPQNISPADQNGDQCRFAGQQPRVPTQSSHQRKVRYRQPH